MGAGSPGNAEAFVYREISGQALEIHVFLPERTEGDPPAAAVLLFHGGGWFVGKPEWTYSEAGMFASMGIVGRAEASDCSPADLAGAGTPPTCIIHGELDTLTPLAGVEKYRCAVVGAGGTCLVHAYEGVGHLLTRNLENQENDFDPDPEKRADGREKLKLFLVSRGFAEQQQVVN